MFVDLWRCFVGRADMYMRDGLHLNGKGQQYLLMNYQQQSKVGKHKNIFGSKHCLN